MLEYASIRLTFVCATPTTVPTIIVSAATGQSTVAQLARMGSSADRNTRTNAANAAAFTPVDMNAVTAGGAPSYASGVHMWNGTAATLNEKPTRRNAIEASWSGVVVTDWVAIRLAMRSKRVLP